MLRDSFTSAFGSLLANKMRSFLTLLGVIIGIYAVVSLLSIARGVQKQMTDVIEGFGPRTLLILPGEQADGQAVNFAAQVAPSTITTDDMDYLDANSTNLNPDESGYIVLAGGLLKKGDRKVGGMPIGISPKALELIKYTITEGRGVTEKDMADRYRGVVVDKPTLEKLDANVGDSVNFGSLELEIMGVYEMSSSGMNFSGGSGSASMFVLPGSLATEINGTNKVHRIIVKAKDVESVDAAKNEIIALLTKKHGSADFTVMLPTDILGTFNSVTDILTYLVVGIASISLLVGGIGISNIMLVTVTERTKEIGIRKAVGATEAAIMLQFLIESVILTLVGAGIGVGMAAGVNFFVKRYSPLTPVLSWETLALALGMGVLTGVVFGLFPAWRAAKKNPVDALRFE